MDLKVQKPAVGIMITNDWGDSKGYRVACECGSNECEHQVWVEADDVGVTTTIYSTTTTNFWSKTRWYYIWTLLTKGYIEQETCVIMSEQQTLNYAEILKSAIKDTVNFRKNKYDENKSS
jgi:hypothetical protein